MAARLFWNLNSHASLAAEHLIVCNSSLTSMPESFQRVFAYPSKPWARGRACSLIGTDRRLRSPQKPSEQAKR